MRCKAILAILIAVLSTDGYAANGQATNPCAAIQVSPQVDECAANLFNAADRALNDAYRLLTKKIDADYQNAPKLKKDFQTAIKKAQRAWIEFRDADCAVEAFEIEAGTAAHTTTVNICLARMTSERTRELQRLLR